MLHEYSSVVDEDWSGTMSTRNPKYPRRSLLKLTIAALELMNAIINNESKSLDQSARQRIILLGFHARTAPLTFCKSKNLVVPVRRKMAPESSCSTKVGPENIGGGGGKGGGIVYPAAYIYEASCGVT